jgi:hypothetical protein
MTYWLPEQALTGKRPVLSVKSLLSSFVTTKTWLEGVATGGGRTTRGASKIGLGFVGRTFLTLLGKMAHDHLVSIRTVPGCIGVGEAIKGVAVSGFDGIKPSLLDRKAQAGMIETNQGTNAGEIKAVWVE